MPTNLKKVISAMKDHTSIGLARIGIHESSALEVAILKATTRSDEPVEDRHVEEVLHIVSSNRCFSGRCARAIGWRVGRTRSWCVAAKSLLLVLRVFQDRNLNFPGEVLQAMRKGYKILNISRFRDESTVGCPWDFTVFVRNFAVYLDEWLVCFLKGKLRPRNKPNFKDVKAFILLERISHWQCLLDRAIATQPTGPSRTNRLVQSCLYAIVQDTFGLYRDISDVLDLLRNKFFHKLKCNDRLNVYHVYVKASKQFKELSSFYDSCKEIGVGKNSEYPTIQHVSEELIDTIKEIVFKDQSSGTSCQIVLGTDMDLPVGTTLRVKGDEYKRGGSLEDLMSVDPMFRPGRYSDPGQIEEFDAGKSDPASKTEGQEQGLVTESEHKEPALSIGECWEIALFETTTTSQESNAHHNLHEVANNNTGFESNMWNNANSERNLCIQSPRLHSRNYYNPYSQVYAVESSNVEPTFKADNNNSYYGSSLWGEEKSEDCRSVNVDSNNPNYFCPGPTFQVAPTFRATGAQMARNDLTNYIYSNPFGSFSNGDQRMSLEMVTFGHTSVDNQFSQCPTFQATPTFRATGLEMTASNLGNKHDGVFGPFSSGSSLAMVPTFQATGLDNPFGSTFQTEPTFHAKGLSQNGPIIKQDDPFESLPIRDVSFLGSLSEAAPTFRADNIKQYDPWHVMGQMSSNESVFKQ